MSVFRDAEQRARFMKSLGTFYAALGGLFGAYRDAPPAFENAMEQHLYRRLELTYSDYPAFLDGFLDFQKLRVAMQLCKVEAEAEMKKILTDEGVDLQGINALVKDAKHFSELSN
jgi:hypothetical protein